VTSHAFLAVDLATDERHALAGALDAASGGRRLPGKRTRPETWHITLRFLGAIDDVTLDLVARELDETMDAEPGRITCRGLDAFPRPARASVVFTAISDPGGLLHHLAAQCDAAALDAGLEPEDRPFVPHLTLTRLRPVSDVRSALASFGDFAVPISVREVALMRSEPSGGIVRYSTVDRFPLR